MARQHLVLVARGFRHLILVRPVHVWDDVEVRAKIESLVNGVHLQPTALETQQHVLVDGPAQLHEIVGVDLAGVALRGLKPRHGPINGMGLGQPPFERAVTGVHVFHQLRIHFEFFPQQRGALFFIIRLGMDQFVKIRLAHFTKHLGHSVRPLLLVINVRVIQVRADLVLEKPGKLLMDQRIVRIVFQPFVAQQLNAALQPAPAVGKILELDRDVVGHVPGLKNPDLRKMRLEFRDPVGELHHLEKLVLLLQIVCANPEQVGDQPAKSAQRDRRKRQYRRGIFQRLGVREAEPVAVAVHGGLHLRHADEQHGGERHQNDFFQARAHLP